MLLVNAVLSAKGQAGAQDILQTALRNILLPDPCSGLNAGSWKTCPRPGPKTWKGDLIWN